MGDQIKVDFSSVEGASSQIGSQAKQIDSQLDDLQRQIASLETTWEGSASGGFQETKRKWETAARDLQQTLAAIGSAVGVAHENYLQTEAKNSSRWG